MWVPFVQRYPNFSDSIGQMGLFWIKIDEYTPESETSTEHLSEGIRIFLITSDKWYLFWNTNLFWAFFRGLQINFVKVGQMVSIPNKPLLNFHLTSSQSLSNLQSIRQNVNNHQSNYAFVYWIFLQLIIFQYLCVKSIWLDYNEEC